MSHHSQCSTLRTTVLPSSLLLPTGDPSICSISNPDFVIYSSVVSFYVPFGVTVLVYARIYMVLRQRRKRRILTRQNSQCISIRPGFSQQVSAWQELGEDTPALSLQSYVRLCRGCRHSHLGDRFHPTTSYSAAIVCALRVGNATRRVCWVSQDLTLLGKR